MSQIDSKEQLGRLAARSWAALQTFLDRQIDFYCRGNRSLHLACEQAGIDAETVVEEIRSRPTNGGPAEDTDWNEQPLAVLVDHIVDRFHQPLHKALPLLVKQADALPCAGGKSEETERHVLLRDATLNLASELNAHLAKEETVLFPWIRQGSGITAGNPIRVMQLEHDAAVTALRHIRKVTGDFTAPAGAPPAIKELYDGLRRLDRDLREHIHLENNVLFPRALSGLPE
jgi:regulator of cell morphogenesis and NO signaling